MKNHNMHGLSSVCVYTAETCSLPQRCAAQCPTQLLVQLAPSRTLPHLSQRQRGKKNTVKRQQSFFFFTSVYRVLFRGENADSRGMRKA